MKNLRGHAYLHALRIADEATRKAEEDARNKRYLENRKKVHLSPGQKSFKDSFPGSMKICAPWCFFDNLCSASKRTDWLKSGKKIVCAGQIYVSKDIGGKQMGLFQVME